MKPFRFTKKQIALIFEAGKEAAKNIDGWKQHCNRLHYAQRNGKQLQYFAKGVFRAGGFTIERCEVTGKVFTWLYCGETVNVCVNLETGKIIHSNNGMIIH